MDYQYDPRVTFMTYSDYTKKYPKTMALLNNEMVCGLSHIRRLSKSAQLLLCCYYILDASESLQELDMGADTEKVLDYALELATTEIYQMTNSSLYSEELIRAVFSHYGKSLQEMLVKCMEHHKYDERQYKLLGDEDDAYDSHRAYEAQNASNPIFKHKQAA